MDVSIENRQAAEAFTQLPAGAASAASGPRLLKPTFLPIWRVPAIAATPTQLVGASTGPPSLPAEITTVPPAATTAWMTVCSAGEQPPLPPRLMLMIWAGLVLSGTPVTCRPAAQRMASRMSELTPPHLPRTRTGRIFGCQVIPVIPVALFDKAPRMPATRVPCHELFSTVQPEKVLPAASALVTQSPGSEASGSLPSLSFPIVGSETKSYPGSSFPLALAINRSG